jgi:hypothetical protein
MMHDDPAGLALTERTITQAATTHRIPRFFFTYWFLGVPSANHHEVSHNHVMSVGLFLPSLFSFRSFFVSLLNNGYDMKRALLSFHRL